uniref:Fibulin 7 n=1 Tax=Terrapene triunguis TaxID=2587831 RepID=A0A674IYK6_9SAUR
MGPRKAEPQVGIQGSTAPTNECSRSCPRLASPGPADSSSDCLSKRQVLSAIQQMQKLLSAQEAARLQGMRSLKKQLTVLNSSFSRQPRCADTRLGSRRCACDTGFQLRDGGVCQGTMAPSPCSASGAGECLTPPRPPRQELCPCPSQRGTCPAAAPRDVDECQLFQASWQSHLCVHDCVNLPGSYRCVCPRGYLRPADQNMCTGEQHLRRGRGERPHSLRGHHGLQMGPSPEPSCALSSAAWRASSPFGQCERNLCPVNSRACRLAANSISFHYLPLQSNRTVPRVLFKMSTTHLVGESLRFAITGGRGQGVFAVRRSEWHAGELILTSPVAGPATLEVELEMSKLARKVLLGKHIFRVTVFISRYEF